MSIIKIYQVNIYMMIHRVVQSLFLAFLLLLLQSGFPQIVQSSPSTEFIVPPKLRPRVNFWKDIFAKYGKHHVVIHHRLYPQVIFEVLDLSLEGEFLSEGEFSRIKVQREKRTVERVKEAIENLSRGSTPRTKLELHINQMVGRYLGSGTAPYLRILREDLVRTQTGIKDKHGEAIRRSGKYIATMEKIFQSYGLPIELTRLPFIESSFDYKAYSSVGAAGIWQFMRATAKKYMTVNGIIDERRDPILATHAAAKYLKEAYGRLGHWSLAVTSYNHGVAGVNNKVSKVGTKDIAYIIEHPVEQVFGFASNNFYPEFLAAVEVYRDRAKLFPQITVDPPEKYVLRALPKSLTISQIGKYYGVSIPALQTVNYALSSGVWNNRFRLSAGYNIKIPTNQEVPIEVAIAKPVEMIVKNPPQQISYVPHQRTEPVYHIVRRGDTLGTIANRYRTSINLLRSLNNLRGYVIRLGQKLNVGSRSVTVPHNVAASTVNYQLYTVRRGDSLTGIAQKFRTTPQKIQQLNALRTSVIHVGQRLKISTVTNQPVKQNLNQPTYYIVRPRDSLWLVARKFGVTVSQIRQLNNLKFTSVRVGQRLRIK
jgi:membrane-bound lytic murein transglycosylase D